MKHLFVVAAFLPALAFANHHEGMKEPSKEQRAQMAEMHTKMAECLKSDKSLKDCRKEMVATCKAGGEEMCPMMGKHMGKHMRHKMKMKEGEDASE